VGEAIEAKVTEYLLTGDLAILRGLRERYPEGLLAVTSAPVRPCDVRPRRPACEQSEPRLLLGWLPAAGSGPPRRDRPPSSRTALSPAGRDAGRPRPSSRLHNPPAGRLARRSRGISRYPRGLSTPRRKGLSTLERTRNGHNEYRSWKTIP